MRYEADSRNSIKEMEMSDEGLQDEIKQMKKKRRKDIYSIIPEALSHNPFMTKIMKSSEFTPQPGVKHTDNIELANSPSVAGGQF